MRQAKTKSGARSSRKSAVARLPVEVVAPTGAAVAVRAQHLERGEALVRAGAVHFVAIRLGRCTVGRGLEHEGKRHGVVALLDAKERPYYEVVFAVSRIDERNSAGLGISSQILLQPKVDDGASRGLNS